MKACSPAFRLYITDLQLKLINRGSVVRADTFRVLIRLICNTKVTYQVALLMNLYTWICIIESLSLEWLEKSQNLRGTIFIDGNLIVLFPIILVNRRYKKSHILVGDIKAQGCGVKRKKSVKSFQLIVLWHLWRKWLKPNYHFLFL